MNFELLKAIREQGLRQKDSGLESLWDIFSIEIGPKVELDSVPSWSPVGYVLPRSVSYNADVKPVAEFRSRFDIADSQHLLLRGLRQKDAYAQQRLCALF